MTHKRRIHRILHGKPTLEGAGVRLHRVFGFGETSTFDPFLLLDDFRGETPAEYAAGFPWHPHRGIETITYVLRGRVEHSDSLGNQGVIQAGDVQWMTAGSGILHQEMPAGDPDGRMYGFQLWANLPRENKMMAPRYQEVKSEAIPTVTLPGGVSARVICGEAAGERGPVENVLIAPRYLDVSLPAGAQVSLPTPPGHTAFAYIFEGSAVFCGESDPFAYPREGSGYFDMQAESALGNRTLVVFTDGEEFTVGAGAEGVRFLLISGMPLRQPVAWYGPIVMNTEAELRQAFAEIKNGTFIKPGKGNPG